MNKFQKMIVFISGLLLIGVSADIRTFANEAPRPEVRALWVDAFRDGFKTPAQVDQLIRDAVDANINTLVVQVRRRGDAYYNQSIEPRTEDPALQPGFDALQDLIEKAHAQHIEVHAWLNTLVAWNKTTPPSAPNHVWNLHGPQTVGRDNWISYSRTYDKNNLLWSEALKSSYYLDPGHPDAVDYTVKVYLNVVKNYDVDGIHLDYSRYAGKGWGFNPTSIARFNARYGGYGMPNPDDLNWQAWQREQTANLVRKIYLNAIAVKPRMKVSSAVITWGDGPVSEGDWEISRAYAEVFQDWQGWLKEGIIDVVMPMNYFSEWNPTQQLWYHRWIDWEKNHQHGRQIVIGPGNFMNYIDDTLEQIRKAQAPSSSGNHTAGIILFAYGASHLYSSDDFKSASASKNFPRQPHQYLSESNSWFFKLLAKEGGYFDPVWNTFIATLPVFPDKVPVPEMPWKTRPQKGYLMGKVTGQNNISLDYLKIIVEEVGEQDLNCRREAYTDGNGWFGMAELPPGQYRIRVDNELVKDEKTVQIVIHPGRVSEVDLSI